MNLTPKDLAGMTPDQIAAYVNAMSAASTPQRAAGTVDEDDIDNAQEGGLPPLPEGTYDFTVLSCAKYMSADQGSGSVPMFRCEMQIDKVVEAGPVRDKTEKTDENPPPGPVIPGESRKWGCKTTGDKANQKQLVRIRDLMQALLRFEPGSKLAETAVDVKGQPVKWAAIMKEATSEANPLGVAKARGRVSISRVITQRGKGFAMYVPTFKKHPDTEARTDNVIRSF